MKIVKHLLLSIPYCLIYSLYVLFYTYTHGQVSTSQECLSSLPAFLLWLVSIHIHSTFPNHQTYWFAQFRLIPPLPWPLTSQIAVPLRHKRRKWHTRQFENFQKLQTISRLQEHPESRAEFNWGNIFFY